MHAHVLLRLVAVFIVIHIVIIIILRNCKVGFLLA